MNRTYLSIALAVITSGLVAASCAGGQVSVPDDDAGTTPTDGGGNKDGGACTSMCNGACADLKTDNANCGKCGTTCPMGATCVAGNCQCAMTQTKCGTTCVDTKTDTANCGKCGTSCGGDGGTIMGGGTWTCANGTCAIKCPMGKTECSGACVDTKIDNDNCGMCGNACVAMTEQCVESQCCKVGETVCNGTCTNINKDPMNCGMCGKQCPAQTPVCNGMGTCIAGCADPNEVQFGGKCYYLDGSMGNCDMGYTRASNATMASILQANANAFQGKNYKHKVSGNCCIWTSDVVENYGMPSHCNTNGPFSAGEPQAGAVGCTNQQNHYTDQLTFCGN
jgi:hypothetical protein